MLGTPPKPVDHNGTWESFMGRVIVALLILAVSISSAQAQSPDKRPIRLLAEAEDFNVEKGQWEVVPFRENYYAATFAISFLSRMACLGAPAQVEQDAIASQKIDVPDDGA